jgi:Domain of unknown function (DUF1918)
MQRGRDGARLGVLLTAVDPSEEDMMETRESHGRTGDQVIVKAHHVAESRRTGVVLEVLGEPDHVHYRVRWDEDGHESIFTPSNDATFEHPADHP